MTNPVTPPEGDAERPRIGDDMMFVIATSGDGCHSSLVRGRDALRAQLYAMLWLGDPADAAEDVAELVDALDDPDEWSGGYYPDRDPFWAWGHTFEDGSIMVQRVTETPAFDRRVSELLAANTREAERRREAEEEVARLRALCAEVYQVVGVLAHFDEVFLDPGVMKVLDNLQAGADGNPIPHADLLPFAIPDAQPEAPLQGTLDEAMKTGIGAALIRIGAQAERERICAMLDRPSNVLGNAVAKAIDPSVYAGIRQKAVIKKAAAAIAVIAGAIRSTEGSDGA